MTKTYDELLGEYDRWYAVWRAARRGMGVATLELYIAELRRAEPELAIVVLEWFDGVNRGYHITEAVTSDGTDISHRVRSLEPGSQHAELAERLRALREHLPEYHPSADWIRVDVRTMDVKVG